MSKFLNPELVRDAFKRLLSRKRDGKTHLERTSALMYFLAFDAACKELGFKSLDMNPDSLGGKNNRKQVELEYTRLVLTERSHDHISLVIELGNLSFGGTSPEKRISSNFFTVPLKKASDRNEAFSYPNRPKAPLLKMGQASTGMKWGIAYHDEWSRNFPRLFTEIKSATPHLDLAIFLLRDAPIEVEIDDLYNALEAWLKKRFTKSVADYFIQKISKEKLLARHTENPFSDHHSLFVHIYKNETTVVAEYEKMKKNELIERVVELEQILKDNGINF